MRTLLRPAAIVDAWFDMLPPGREDCPRCNGAIAGVVLSAGEHYAAAADFRRELRALGERDEKRRMKKLAAGTKKKRDGT